MGGSKAAFAIVWKLYMARHDLARPTLRAYMESQLRPGVFRIGLRRWGQPRE